MISFIVIEYNSIEEILKCANQICECCRAIDYELIISSNSLYSAEKQKQLEQDFPTAIWSFNERNGGFAYGMNQGLAMAKGEYLVIMNPDVQIFGEITTLASFLADHPQVGAVAPQIIGHNGEIQDSCRSFVTPARFFSRQLRRLFTKEVSVRSRDVDYGQIQTVDSVIGAFIMISHKMYDIVGGLDEGYFMYAEDIDWCTRIWQAGYQVVYNPKVQVIYEGSRRARTTWKYAKIFIESHLRYWRKFGFFAGYPETQKILFEN